MISAKSSRPDLSYLLVQPRKRKTYRGEVSIAESILQIVSQGGTSGVNASRVVTVSGLIYRDTIEKCQKLIDAGLLESWREGRLLLFRITPKGLEFLSELQYFLNLIRLANLRC